MNQIFSISFYFVFFFFEPIEALKIKIISTRLLKSKRAMYTMLIMKQNS